MSNGELLDAQPDLLLLLKRDGVLLSHVGGRNVAPLCPGPDSTGRLLSAFWPQNPATLVLQLVRRAIAGRTTVESRFEHYGKGYEARVSAQSPERAICVVRESLAAPVEESVAPGAESAGLPAHLDRRNFRRRFKESMSLATLYERPTAVAVVQIDGIVDISRIIDSRVAEQVMGTAVQRLAAAQSDESDDGAKWYMGQLSEAVMVIVVESSDRERVEARVAAACASLREPIRIGDTCFNLTPHAGIAILGQDAATPKLLLEHARSAAAEASRSNSGKVCFFSDTLRLRSLARLDIARELSDAIANKEISLRYVGRHDLTSGATLCAVGYLRWQHPLRGEIRPAEFIKVAEATGLAASLSRAVLERLGTDYPKLRERCGAQVCVSFGALRHHILHDRYDDDIAQFLALGSIPPERLELRIAERALVLCEPRMLRSLARLGVRMIVDEVGRGMGSFDVLARAPLAGLQLDRSWVTAMRSETTAAKVCRAAIGVAHALGLESIATAVDDGEQLEALLQLGCMQGLGDHYEAIVIDADERSLETAPVRRAGR